MLPLNRIVAATVVVIAVGAGSILLFSNRSAGPGVGGPRSVPPSASPSASAPTVAPTVTPSPTQPPVSFTSPLYRYTVNWPPGGGWDVTPATVPWPEQTALTDGYWDAFRGPAGAYQDFDDVYVAAQPVPEGMTPEAWLLDYAQRMAASGRDCKGPVDAWTDDVVGSLAIRRIDLGLPGDPPLGCRVRGRWHGVFDDRQPRSHRALPGHVPAEGVARLSRETPPGLAPRARRLPSRGRRTGAT